MSVAYTTLTAFQKTAIQTVIRDQRAACQAVAAAMLAMEKADAEAASIYNTLQLLDPAEQFALDSTIATVSSAFANQTQSAGGITQLSNVMGVVLPYLQAQNTNWQTMIGPEQLV